ncbi:copper resistance protein D [Thermobispora bispora]|uniref:Copper resistance D domain protein n=1 Tax=Thermobispora bispora (strain ATCC 19993 / DSM 43833 / CBS 139.67 / JCM 10125 / KCTC 9307 / NBRC 14880 / R51) TaxID=469371 RepID=D6Y8R6_THEBD|nr:cytochrome c oxidase assembly protein [Thermobispora bispora]ADG87963.1 copper resistance D domain protein [Thermobispora bispora DSM 43833]MDI9581004.1 cytochrome c oxidase assembly protein [Thermobispora sp.]
MSRIVRLAVAAACAAAVALIIGMVAGGAATPRIIPGLPDEGALTRWMLPVSKLALDGAAALTVGLLLFSAMLLPSDKGMLGKAAQGYVRAASWAALAWAAAAASALMFGLSETLGVPVDQLLGGSELTSYASQVPQGIALTLVVLFAASIAMFARGTMSVGATGALLLFALATTLPPPLTGHSATSPNHGLAITSVAFHVVCLAPWVGGLVVLCVHAFRKEPHLAVAAARFSRMALWCFIGVGLSGVASAAARLTSIGDLFTSAYGGLVLAKIAAFAVLGFLGWRHRVRTLPRLEAGEPYAFVSLAMGEVMVMTATLGLAVALSRTAPPPVQVPLDRAYELLGYPMPPPVSLGNLATLWYFDLFFAVVCALLAGLYAAGMVRLRRRGDAWPWGRAISWYLGVAILVLATQSGLARYAPVLFSVHMVQHMLQSMLIPILLVLGAPMTLALRALKPSPRRGDRGPREWLQAFLHNGYVRFWSHPAVATVNFVASPFLLYFTPLFSAAMRDHLGHLAMQVHFLLSGFLFFWLIIGVDPAPRRLPHIQRLLLLLVTTPFHAFFGVATMTMGSPIAADWFDGLGRTWGGSALADQRLGGGIAWAFTEIPTLIVLIALAIQWWRADERAARRAERRADAIAAKTGGTGDPELDAYNEYLARLHKRDAQLD